MVAERRTLNRARRLLAVGSWTSVATVACASLTLAIPPLARLTEIGHPLGPILGQAVAVGIVIGIVCSWIGGLWHGFLDPGFLSEGHRAFVILLLLFPYSGMVYFFVYVFWSHRLHEQRAVAQLLLPEKEAL